MSSISEKDIEKLNRILRMRGEFISEKYEKYKNSRENLKVIDKGKFDSVTDIDKESQRRFLIQLKRYGYDRISEEKQLPLMVGQIFFLIDPLEATENFRMKCDRLGFGTSLGLVENGVLVYVGFYNSASKELYYATKNGGAYKNGERIHVRDDFYKSRIIFNHWDNVEKVGHYLDKLRSGKQKITDYTPTTCSDAVDICMVATGQAHGLVFVYKEAAPWDMMTALLIEEAGGKVSDINGGPWYVIEENGHMKTRNSMIAGNEYAYQALFDLYNSKTLNRLSTTKI